MVGTAMLLPPLDTAAGMAMVAALTLGPLWAARLVIGRVIVRGLTIFSRMTCGHDPILLPMPIAQRSDRDSIGAPVLTVGVAAPRIDRTMRSSDEPSFR